jgi:hypothetical protein
MKKKQLRVMMRVISTKIQINCFSFVLSMVVRDGFLYLGFGFSLCLFNLVSLLFISSIFSDLVDVSKGVRIYHVLAPG